MRHLDRHWDRRSVVIGFAQASALLATCSTFFPRALADEVKAVSDLKPGEFTWHPERASDGPVAIVVSLPDQRVYVYRNGIRIGVSTCSTGKPGHATPTGVFTILEKDKDHRSSTYNNAPMPNMNRLTWSGVALHAGRLPGYPASHGCIRLPFQFSKLLFSVTHVGTPVIVADNHVQPATVVHPGMVLSDDAERAFEAVMEHGLKEKTLPWGAEVVDFNEPTSVVVSGADKSMTILAGGKVVAEGPVTIADDSRPLGSHVFVLAEAQDQSKQLTWHGISHGVGSDGALPDAETAVIRRITAKPELVHELSLRMHPGVTMITTDLPAHPETRSGKDFVLMTTEVG